MEESSDCLSKTIDRNVPLLSQQRVISCFPSVSERYYKHKVYTNNEKSNNNELLVLAHSNRICIITLSPRHEIITSNQKVIKVDFSGDKIDRLKNKVQGKWKKGAQKVTKDSAICQIECEDGSIYKINACISGKIIEVNQRLLQDPSLVTKKTWTDGYIAILLPPFQSNEVANLMDYSECNL